MKEGLAVHCAADAVEFEKLRTLYGRDPVVIPLIELAAAQASILGALPRGTAQDSGRADEAFKTLAVMLECREEIVQTERHLLAELASIFAKSGKGSASEPWPACGACPLDHDISTCDSSRCAERLADWARDEAAKRFSPAMGGAAGPGTP